MTADLNHACEKEFMQNIPQQYINVGIAEQNMIGIAAGLALSGMKVFAYSITPFVTMRCFEQVKIDVCYQNLDVNLIGVGAGFAYGPYGNTHCTIEDIAVMRVLPNMKIVSPANPLEAEQLTEQVIKSKGPFYLRLGRGKEPMPENNYAVKLGKGHIVNHGKDISLIAVGTIIDEAVKAAKILEHQGISSEVINMHTVKPLDKDIIEDCIKHKKAIFTIEEHNVIGGLGSAVADVISQSKINKQLIFKKFGVQDKYLKIIGDQNYLREKHGISADAIAKTILEILM